jgi:hypothetical protein
VRSAWKGPPAPARKLALAGTPPQPRYSLASLALNFLLYPARVNRSQVCGLGFKALYVDQL